MNSLRISFRNWSFPWGWFKRTWRSFNKNEHNYSKS